MEERLGSGLHHGAVVPQRPTVVSTTVQCPGGSCRGSAPSGAFPAALLHQGCGSFPEASICMGVDDRPANSGVGGAKEKRNLQRQRAASACGDEGGIFVCLFGGDADVFLSTSNRPSHQSVDGCLDQ